MAVKTTVRTCLWFDGRCEEAATLYTSLLPDSVIEGIGQPDPNGPVIELTIGGVPYKLLNGGPEFTHSPAASISLLTPDQAETDRLWDALIDGGAEGQCGWLKDRFGVWWQIMPEAVPRMLGDPDPNVVNRVREATMQMGKLDIAALEAAFQEENPQ